MTKKRLQDPELITIAGQVACFIGFAEYLKRLVKFDKWSQRSIERSKQKQIRKLVDQLEEEIITARSSLRVIESSLEREFLEMPRDIIALNIEEDEFLLYRKALMGLQQSTSKVSTYSIDLQVELKEYDLCRLILRIWMSIYCRL